jgi:histidinol dehydrogenase
MFPITTIDYRTSDATPLIDELRAKLSPRGDIVSEAGRQRTIDLFGEALSPQQVVERICGDVKTRGLAALLHYTEKLDRKTLTRESMRVPAAELAAAHAKASPEFLATLRHIRENIEEFQKAILIHDAGIRRPLGRGIV